MKTKRIAFFTLILFFAIVIGYIVNVIFFSSSRDFAGLNGEVLLMQGDAAPEFPVVRYNPRTKKTFEIKDIYYYPQYNVNSKNNIIAIIDENNMQNIYELSSGDGSSYSRKRLIYSGRDVEHPKFVPGKDSISFIEDNKLFYYDIEIGGEPVFISNMSSEYYDWLDSDTVLYSMDAGEGNYNIMAYNIANRKAVIFKNNALAPALSINKKFLAYRLSNDSSVVILEQLNTVGPQKSIKVNAQGILPYKPSPDGKYLAGAVYNLSKTDVIIINVDTNKTRTIFPSMLPAVIDWKS
ncbi:MAG TPA: hypothetical protein VMS09_12725 [Paenibacillus sp.]|uniref:hypothetical protein n=1 Tax=Paenibacillus sp. TaxID=58172 RepID=UPI0028D5B65C|nr:hypothetical protein [Paenibacillus sp.]HUC92866.1 hypothetical protein [Paenibacillus sp.]